MPAPSALEVHVDLGDAPVLAGLVYLTVRRGTVTSRFEYDNGYLASSDSFDLSPHLRRRDRSATATGLHGVFADAAPDRWGRNLIKRRIQGVARDANSTPPLVTEVDYLCGVSDLTRQGALRFRARGGEGFLADGVDVPRLIELPRLLAATLEVAGDQHALAAVKLLLDAGSASLGGARPKASVRDGERLALAKFPHPSDEWNVMAWEATVLDLAARCGITVPSHRLERVGKSSVLLLDRFDRDRHRRIPYISAMTLLDRADGQDADYVELAEALSAHGSQVRTDLQQLWRRIAFSIAVNNTDDHLRNHGLLRRDSGWSLAPIFDVNPNPNVGAHRMTSIVGATSRNECLRALFASGESFGISGEQATMVWAEVREAVSDWRSVATANGISTAEQRDFVEVFDASPEP